MGPADAKEKGADGPVELATKLANPFVSRQSQCSLLRVRPGQASVATLSCVFHFALLPLFVIHRLHNMVSRTELVGAY